MVGSLSVATTAVSSAKVDVVDPGEVGRSAVYSRYKIKWDYKQKNPVRSLQILHSD
jgi:hypothetical protein